MEYLSLIELLKYNYILIYNIPIYKKFLSEINFFGFIDIVSSPKCSLLKVYLSILGFFSVVDIYKLGSLIILLIKSNWGIGSNSIIKWLSLSNWSVKDNI